MAYSYTEYTGDGTTASFNVSFSYFSTEHVVVYVDNIKVTSFTIETNLQTLTLDVAPASGASIMIRRVTPRDRTYSNFTRGNRFGEASVNNSFRWLLYIAQEILEGGFSDFKLSGDLDINGNKIVNVGECTADSDAVNLGYLNRIFSTLSDTYKDMVAIVTQAVSDVLGYKNAVEDLKEDIDDILNQVEEYQGIEVTTLTSGQVIVTFSKTLPTYSRYDIVGTLVDNGTLLPSDYTILDSKSIQLKRSYPAGTQLRATQTIYKSDGYSNPEDIALVAANVSELLQLSTHVSTLQKLYDLLIEGLPAVQQKELVELASSQTIVEFTSVNVYLCSFYIDSAFADNSILTSLDYEIQGDSSLLLKRSYPLGTKILAVQANLTI